MDLTSVQKQPKDSMLAELTKCLQDTEKNTRNLVTGANRPTEPDYIAHLVVELPRLFNQRFGPWFAKEGITLKAAGVFVHQTPKVKADSFPDKIPASVEVGDLLIIVAHVHKAVTERWALLLQAKITRGDPLVKPDHANQHHLYNGWPEVCYVKSGDCLNGKRRNVRKPESDIYRGAKYLLMDFNSTPRLFFRSKKQYSSSSGCPIGTADPTCPRLSGPISFADELLDILFGNAGRSFTLNTADPPKDGDWDQLVSDLLYVTAKKYSVYMKGSQSGKRGQGVFFISQAEPSFLHEKRVNGKFQQLTPVDRPPVVSSWDDLADDDPGMSVIELTLTEAGADED